MPDSLHWADWHFGLTKKRVVTLDHQSTFEDNMVLTLGLQADMQRLVHGATV
jgi:hypothetical protein